MKVLYQSYDFNALNKTITFNSGDTVSLNNILIITNVTRNIIIYNFASPLHGGVLSGNTLTLTYDTSLMLNTDELQIFLDLYGSPATEGTLSTLATENTANLLLTLSNNIDSSTQLLKRIAKIVEPISVQDAAQRQRIIIDGIVSGTLTTVTTVSNLGTISGIDYRWQLIDQARNTYSNSIRNNITF